MSNRVTEFVVEQAALTWLESLSWSEKVESCALAAIARRAATQAAYGRSVIE